MNLPKPQGNCYCPVCMAIRAVEAAAVPPPKMPRVRKEEDCSQLVHRITGRLTPSYWIIKEGFTQDVRQQRSTGRPGAVSYDWMRARRVAALCGKGYLAEVKGPRGGVAFRTTGEGAFAMLIAEGIHEAKKLPKEVKNG